MKVIRNITYWAATVAEIAVIMITAMLTPIGLRASAETGEETEDIVAEYEETNVWDNLKGSTIAGNAFNPADYPHAEKDKPRILSFVEFCYSLYSDNQDDYGLYVYLYNPQDLVFDTETLRNQIQLRCGSGNYEKYNLVFLNYSKQAGYEGRFWKFKVNLTETQKRNILKSLNQNSRVYEISGITLSNKKKATEYASGQKYTYSGYVKGYGSELAENDTLTCGVDNFDKYVELDVKQTCYRPQGDYYEGKQSQLNSCYFRVPEKYFTDYGELSEIVCEWWEYVTKPILVTESSYLYQRLYALHGGDISNFSSNMYFAINLCGLNDTGWFHTEGKGEGTISNFENFKDKYTFWDGGNKYTVPFEETPNIPSNFAAVFYAGKDKSYKDRYITSEELREQLLMNSEILGAPYFTERYSAALFDEVVNDNHIRGYNRKSITKDTLLDIFWNVTTKSLWQTIFGGYNVETKYDSAYAIVEIDNNSLKGTDAEIAARLYVNEGDVKSIKEEFANCKDERLILFRYGESDYYSVPCTESYYSANTEDVDTKLVKDIVLKWDKQQFSAYVAQETVYLDFDIISLWFTADDGAKTEIPVVMSPQDVISGLDPPLDMNFHNGKAKLIIALIIVVLIIVAVLIVWWILRKIFPKKTKNTVEVVIAADSAKGGSPKEKARVETPPKKKPTAKKSPGKTKTQKKPQRKRRRKA